MESSFVDLVDELISKPLFPAPLEPTVFPPQVFKILALLMAVLVVLVVVMWYHCGDEILTFLDLDAPPKSPLHGHHYDEGEEDGVDMTGVHMDAQLRLQEHEDMIKAGTHSGRGAGSKKAGGKKGGGGGRGHRAGLLSGSVLR